jgi:hypothetical protein
LRSRDPDAPVVPISVLFFVVTRWLDMVCAEVLSQLLCHLSSRQNLGTQVLDFIDESLFYGLQAGRRGHCLKADKTGHARGTSVALPPSLFRV